MINFDYKLKCPKCNSTNLSTDVPNDKIQDDSVFICGDCNHITTYEVILSYNEDSIISELYDKALDEVSTMVDHTTKKYKK